MAANNSLAIQPFHSGVKTLSLRNFSLYSTFSDIIQTIIERIPNSLFFHTFYAFKTEIKPLKTSFVNFKKKPIDKK